MNVKRPVLIGGLGLTAGLWLLDAVTHASIQESAVLGVMALGSGFWWLQKRAAPVLESPPRQTPVCRDAIDQALSQVDQWLAALQAECSTGAAPDLDSVLAHYRQQRQAILANLERDTLHLSLWGQKSTGKTTLLNQLGQADISGHLTGSEADLADDLNPEADLVLLVMAGDLADSEYQRLQTLVQQGYPVLLVCNKQDQSPPMERALVLERIRARVQPLGVEPVAIAAAPNPIKHRRHLETGEVEESWQQPAPDIGNLIQSIDRLAQGGQLVMATGLRQANALKRSVIGQLNHQRRQRALPVIEQMQWIAAGTAFANPLATLDLLAAVAINAQLVIDLGAIYGQSFSLEQAKAGAGEIAKLTVKLGLVELATQALGTVLKGHAVTYVAGGALQGISAAYLTRLAGLTLIDFFQEQSLLEPAARRFAFDQLGDRLHTLFQQARQGLALQAFVADALTHLPGKAPSLANAAEPNSGQAALTS